MLKSDDTFSAVTKPSDVVGLILSQVKCLYELHTIVPDLDICRSEIT